jgi:hypothetical protein
MTRTNQLSSPDFDINRPDNCSSSAMAPQPSAIHTNTVYVVFTTVDETLAAVRVAAEFAKALAVPLTVVHFRTVPYAAPIEMPGGISPIETEGFIARLRREKLDVRLRVYLCRDERRAIPFVFKPHSLITAGGHRRHWWPTRSQRLRRALEAAGHFVVFVDISEHRADRVRETRDVRPAMPVSRQETAHA